MRLLLLGLLAHLLTLLLILLSLLLAALLSLTSLLTTLLLSLLSLLTLLSLLLSALLPLAALLRTGGRSLQRQHDAFNSLFQAFQLTGSLFLFGFLLNSLLLCLRLLRLPPLL